jgi:hypothetical protein
MLNNISKLQIQQILKHPQIASVRTPKLAKTYTYKVIVKSRHTQFYVLETREYFIYIYILHQKIVTAF